MICPGCNRPNDPDAVFCEHCGKSLGGEPLSPSRLRRMYLYALFLLPIIAAVSGAGYYKFILPGGAAAVVNGEEIRRSELDAALSLERKAQEALYGTSVFDGDQGKEFLAGLRYAVLTELIRERLMLQEAHTAGVAVSDADVASAEARIQASSSMDRATFNAYISARYGGEQAFHEMIRRKLLIDRFVSGNVIAGLSDPKTAEAAVSRWFNGLFSRAAVRISLAEQWSAAGRGCCGRDGAHDPEQAGRMESPRCASGGCGVRAGTRMNRPLPPEKEKAAVEAGLSYWHKKYGSGPVAAKVTDFGCHIRIDIVRDGTIIKSLRYDGDVVTEM